MQALTREESLKALRVGGYLAIFQTAITVALIWYATSQEVQSGPLESYNNPWSYPDAIIMFFCALGMFKHSRVAAVIALLLTILNGIFQITSDISGSGILVRLGIMYLYFRAARGAFTLRRIKRAENPELKGTSRWVIAIPSVVGLGLAAILGLGLMMKNGVVPLRAVERGINLDAEIRENLVEIGILYSDERVEQYYFLHLFSPYAEGVLLTDHAVVYYYKNEEQEFEIWGMPFNEISSVELVEKGGFLLESMYLFDGFEEDTWLRLPLSAKDNGDENFVEAVRARINK